MPSIQYIENDNRYCVPAALAIILGISPAEALSLIKEELGDTSITGVFYPVILKILKKKNIHSGMIHKGIFSHLGTYLVCMKGHVGVIENGFYFDNSYTQGVSIYNFKLPRIEAIYKINL